MEYTIFFYLFLLLSSLFLFTKQLLNKIQNLPPSPFPALPILGHLYLLKKPLHRTLAKISARHGPILLLQFGSRRVLLVSSPSIAEECFTKNDIVFANRPRLLIGKHLGYNFSSLAWAPYGDHWRNLRRIASLEVLSTHRLQALQPIRVDETRLLMRRLFRASERTVDMKSMLFEVLLNVMMRMIAGKRYYGENVAELAEAKRFKEIVAETFHVAGASNLGDFLPAMKWVVARGVEERMIVLRKKRDEFVQELIEEHRGKKMGSNGGVGGGGGREGSEVGGGKKSMIEVLLSLQETEADYYTDEIIKGLMMVLLAAGTDTSVGTMEWALSLLVNNPEVLKKAQIEIDNHVGQDRLFNESDIADLPYLHCIITETMRMYPPGPLLVPHESSVRCTLGDYSIPGGTMLLVNEWAIQNDPKLWSEPRKFKPERFEGLQGTRDGFKFMPFGSGRRACPGEGLAMRMVGLVLGSLIQCFDWERLGKEMVDMTEGTGLTLPKLRPLVVKFQPRPTMINQLSQI